MRQRVMIAIGLACNPKLVIADEPTTALDVTIQAQILELMKDLSRKLNIALIVITHNLGVVARYADRVIVMYAAKMVEQGRAEAVFHEPRHPYTMGLLRSVPRLDRPRGNASRNHRGPGSQPRQRPARLPLRAALPVPDRALRGGAAAGKGRQRVG
jgi:ABC-type dipeptide/oligopeptide/nickel transport system ATPase component